MTIVLRFFPNGEFTQGVDTSRRSKPCAEKIKISSPTSKECRDGYLRWVRSSQSADIHLCVPGMPFVDNLGRKWYYLFREEGVDYFEKEGWEEGQPNWYEFGHPVGKLIGMGLLLPLVHQSVESSPTTTESRKKLESMTKRMARNIRNGVYLLEKKEGKDNLSFLTLTLPSLCASDMDKICDRWASMTDQILKWLRKRVEAKGIEFQYVYCTEIQTKRLKKKHEYAPHLHIVFKGRRGKKAAWSISPIQVRKAWASIIGNVVAHRSFPVSALENLQRVKHSAARYLSKYLSKGSCCLPGIEDCPQVSRLRTQWGGMAQRISRAIKQCTSTIRSDGANGRLGVLVLQRMEEALDKGLISYIKYGFISLGVSAATGMERFLKVACGCLRTPTYEGGLVKLVEFLYSYGDV